MLVFWISLGLALSLVVGIVITKLTDRTQEHTYNFSVTVWPPGDFSCVLSTSEADAVKGQPITDDICETDGYKIFNRRIK